MEVSMELVRQNFQSKTDTELLEIATTGQELTSEARFLLVQELQNRLAQAKRNPETVQLVHGWYIVVAPAVDPRFPTLCPRCCRSDPVAPLQFASPERRRFHRFWWKTTQAVSCVPHCSKCAAEVKKDRLIWSWTGGVVSVAWLAAAIWFEVPKLIIYLGIFMVALPTAYLYDRTSAVKLGDHAAGVLEYRLKSHDYAKAFAELNNVQPENAETLQSDLEDAISRLEHA